jgi:hypothetical protein
VNYKEVRSRIANGDVLAFHYAKWSPFSQLISLWTRSRISHVGMVMRVNGRVAVIEALEGCGVRVYPVSKILSSGRKLEWYALKPGIDRREVVHEALGHWGQRYASPWQFIRSFSVVTKWLLDKWGVRNDISTKRFFCSEFVAWCLRAGGWGSLMPPSRMSPADICEMECLTRKGVLEWTTSDSTLPL